MIDYNFLEKKEKKFFLNENKREFLSSVYLSVKEYNNAIIIPNDNLYGGVYSENKFVYNTSLHRNWVKNFPEKIQCNTFIDEEVVYIGMFHDVWGHCITDNIKHLWFLFDERYSNLHKLKFVYTTVFDNFRFSNNFSALLSKFNIDSNKLIQIKNSVQYKKIYIPDECFFFNDKIGNYQYTKEYKKLIDMLTRNVISLPLTFDKIYYSRTGITDHRDIGENKVENYFIKKGYKVIHPELISFEENLVYLQNCKTFASTEGSISHNILFCKPNTNVIIIRKSIFGINSYQSLIDRIDSKKVTYIQCSKSILNSKKTPWSGPFFLYISHNLTNFFQEKSKIFPLFSFVFQYLLFHIPRILYRKFKSLLRNRKHD